MIVVLKYNKNGNMVYVSHIDLLRHFTRTFRRAGLEVEFSNGFNPHMLINLGTPLPLGINSSSEYLTVHTDVPADEFMRRYNEVVPAGMEAIKAWNLSKNPGIVGGTVAADYSVKQNGAEASKKEIEGIVNMESFEMTFEKKGEKTIKNIQPLINAIKVNSDSINFCIAAGNTTLRADKFAAFLAEKYGFEVSIPDVWKYEQYIRKGGVLCEMDQYLDELVAEEE